MKTRITFIMFFVIVASPLIKAATQYNVLDLGANVIVNDISNSGMVVGSKDGYIFQYNCLTRSSVALPIREGQNSSISNTGRIVGTYVTEAGLSHAFSYYNGQFDDLGTLGGRTSHATSVNDKGLIVGSSETSNGACHAFSYYKPQIR